MTLRKLINLFTEATTTAPATKANAGTAAGYKGSAGAQAIAQASGIKDVNKIKVGQSINLPGGGTYQVQKGDTLDKIARNNPAPAAPAVPALAPAPAVQNKPDADAAAKQNVFAPTAAPAAAPTAAPAAAPTAAPAQATDPKPAIDPVVASGQNIGGQFAKAASDKAAQDSFAQISGMAPKVAPAAPAPAAPAPTVKTAQDFTGSGTVDASNQPKPAPDSGSSMTNPANAALGQTGAGSSSYTSTAGMSGIDNTKPVNDPQAVKGGFGQSTNVRTDTPDQIAKRGPMGITLPESEIEEELEKELEEALGEMLRLSGIHLNEKAPPGAKSERMVKHIKKGYAKDGKLTPKEKSIAYATAWKAHKKSKVSESIMLEAGSNLEHIVTRFKHETKNFLNGADLDEDLYNALYDYYIDNGEMPYGVAKAREGDPYQWVSDHFADELSSMGHSRQFQETVMPVMDDTLSELARLAGLSESRVDECGDMGMDQRDSMNISTNMSSDGTKSVTISAQGDQAEALVQMLKLAGMGHMGHDSHTEEPVVMVSNDDDEMMEYANDPNQEYHSVDSIIHQGTDLHRKKDMYPTGAKLGDNPMAEQIVDEELQSLLDSVLVKADEGSIKKDGPNDLTGTWSSDPPKKGQPDVPPPVPMDPVYPAAPKSPSSPALSKPGMKK